MSLADRHLSSRVAAEYGTGGRFGWQSAPHPSDPQYHPVCLLQKLKPLMADLKKVYAAPPEETALSELDSFDEKWSGKYPKIAKSWRDNRANLSTYFKYPEAVRRLIYTMNTIEGGTASFVK